MPPSPWCQRPLGHGVARDPRGAAPLTYERAGAEWLVLLLKVMVIVREGSGIGRYLVDRAGVVVDRDRTPSLVGLTAYRARPDR